MKPTENFTRRLIRLPAVKNRSALGKSAIYERIKEKTFPKPVSLGGRAVAWVESEVDDWVNARIRQRDEASS